MAGEREGAVKWSRLEKARDGWSTWREVKWNCTICTMFGQIDKTVWLVGVKGWRSRFVAEIWSKFRDSNIGVSPWDL